MRVETVALICLIALLISSIITWCVYYYLNIYRPNKEKEKKLAEMREAGKCCANCKYFSTIVSYDHCRRASGGYSPISGNALLRDCSQWSRCKETVGTKNCEWEEK